jgi:hypothetical protein
MKLLVGSIITSIIIVALSTIYYFGNQARLKAEFAQKVESEQIVTQVKVVDTSPSDEIGYRLIEDEHIEHSNFNTPDTPVFDYHDGSDPDLVQGLLDYADELLVEIEAEYSGIRDALAEHERWKIEYESVKRRADMTQDRLERRGISLKANISPERRAYLESLSDEELLIELQDQQ